MTPGSGGAAERLVRRNTLYLLAAQVLVVPLTVITNVLVARYLGPAAFGQLYLATTLTTLGFLFVEFGQGTALAGLVAARQERAAELLGSALCWRAVTVIPVSCVLFAAALILGYSREAFVALSLMLLIFSFGTVSNACYDVLRGRERTGLGAATFVAWKLLIVAVMVPVLLTKGGLPALLVAQAACTGIGALFMIRLLRTVHVANLTARWATVKELAAQGLPFIALSLVLALQENVDAAWLARLAGTDAIGWYAVARKLIGLLVYPANALTVALYPTLSRLQYEDRAQFIGTAAGALRTTVVFSVPVAFGSLLFPQLGVWFFNGDSFGPAAADLRVLSAWLLLLYLSMPLSTLLMAGGRRSAWVSLQLLCVVVSAALDPWLIPLCQSQFGNGGLGVCVSIVAGEILMVAGGIWLAPAGVFDRRFTRSIVVSAAGALAMTAVALLLQAVSAWLVAPLALAAYALVQMAFGGLSWPALVRILRT